MTVHTLKSPVDLGLAEQFQALLPHLPGTAARKKAFAEFEKTGLPGRRLEAWHYTDWRAMQKSVLPPVSSESSEDLALASLMQDPFSGIKAYDALLVNAQGILTGDRVDFAEVLELSEAIRSDNPLIAHLGTAFSAASDPMAALNEAMYLGGVLARFKKGSKLALPIHAFSTGGSSVPASLHARALVIVEDDVELTLLDTIVGPDDVDSQVSTVVEFIIGRNAKVEYVTFNGLGRRTLGFTGVGVRMGAHSQFSTINIAVGGAVARHQVHVAMEGEGGKLGVRGIALLNGNQHADSTLAIDHIAPGCESRELFRTVVDGEATGVFQGRIMVKKDAQKTDGQMASNALLLSEGASMNNKPELEIFADDVVCAHGATCGELDEDLLFYLQARGLPRKEAEALMIHAFVGEVLEFVSHEEARERLNGVVERWLKARQEG
jgi:Fe-S cluster assembly protein SufD